MKFPILLLFLTPFGLAVACGARTGLAGEGEDREDVDGADDSTSEDTATDIGPPFDPDGPVVHCAPGGPGAPASTVTCAPGSDCHVEGDSIICGARPPTLNCGRLNCSGRCECLFPTGPNASCICH